MGCTSRPHDLFTHLRLAVTYAKLGRDQEARAEAAEVLRIHPKCLPAPGRAEVILIDSLWA